MASGLGRGSAVAFLLVLLAPALAGNGPCANTANEQRAACQAGAAEDYRRERAICINESDSSDRAQCFEDAEASRSEELALCDEQHQARLQLCAALGPGRYDPDFDEQDFEDDFTQLANPNLYFPLTIGHRWDYAGGDETIRIVVRNATKLIDDVTCIVVNDVVRVDGEVVEDTDDWIAQARDGTAWYCGEEVKDYETFDGDEPPLPELVSIDGSFKAGREGDKPGVLVPAVPRVGQTYRIEWSPGNAEDAARVLSTSYGYGHDRELDRFVPPQLARTFCAANNCLVIGEFTPLEPEAFELKYYAPHVGRFLEVSPRDHKAVRLVGCNFDPRCASLH